MRIDEKLLPPIKMKFQKRPKARKKGRHIAVSVSQNPHGMLYVNTNAVALLTDLGFKFVEIFVDPDVPAIRIKKVDSPIVGYKLTTAKSRSGSVSGTIAVRLQDELPAGRYFINPEASTEDDVVFIFYSYNLLEGVDKNAK